MNRYTAYKTITDPEEWEETDEILHLNDPPSGLRIWSVVWRKHHGYKQ